MEFQTMLRDVGADVDKELDRVLPHPSDGPEGELFEAMRYAVLGGGKRLRAFLVVASSRLFEVSNASAIRTAAAVECLHSYSLVHDDLPCMDDDELRRGKATVHIKYNEATAVLAGDGLLTLAFELIGDAQVIPNSTVRADLMLYLAQAAGARGMVGGQILDMNAVKLQLSEMEIVRLQRLKTGALIAYAAETGAILARAGKSQRHHLNMFAHDLGLAFQITDDILDMTGTREEMGKAVKKDAAADKATFVQVLGLEAAQQRARLLADQASRHLEIFGAKAEPLRGLAEFVITRRS